jgi:hypothetical protein
LISDRLNFNYTFAHELQHLLFHLYFGIYAPSPPSREYVWINEALSEAAGQFYTLEGTQVVRAGRIVRAPENPYTNTIDPREGDFVNFNNSHKNYGIGKLHASFMHENTNGTYAKSIFEYFRNFLPTSSTPAEFIAARAKVPDGNMPAIIGNAFNYANLTGSLDVNGTTAFNLLYFLFMENFASDGGQIFNAAGTEQTRKFFSDTFSAFNLWGIRPALGLSSAAPLHLGGAFRIATSLFPLDDRPAIPVLNSGGNISLVGYNLGAIPRGATHEMLYRLTGHTTANPIIRIAVNDNNPQTQYYIAVPKEAPETTLNTRRGQFGADVFPLARNGVFNYVNTNGRQAHLFVVTLYRNVNINSAVTYSWRNTMPVTFASGITARVNGVPINPAAVSPNSNIEFSATPPDDFHIAIWSVDGAVQNIDSMNPFIVNGLQRNINNVSVNWLRVGAISSGGTGYVTSEDITYLARHIVGHQGFPIADRRIANLRGFNREPRMSDVTQMAKWLVGYKFENLCAETQV